MRLATVAASVLTSLVVGGCAGEAPQADAPAAETSAASADASAPATPQTPGRAMEVEGGEYRDIIVPELQAMLENEDFTLINVHVPFAGDLPGTDASIRYDEITSHLDQLPSKDARIVLYCRTGPMSTRAARELVGLGYTDVYNLVGGFTSWVEAGLPLAEN